MIFSSQFTSKSEQTEQWIVLFSACSRKLIKKQRRLANKFQKEIRPVIQEKIHVHQNPVQPILLQEVLLQPVLNSL